MEQVTFDDDDLFGEAAGELEADVEASLEAGWNALPDADSMWSVEADNVLGVLNTLRTTLDAGEAEDHFREAKKWFTLGENADAFEDPEALREEIHELEQVITDLASVRNDAGELASTLPRLRDTLPDASDPPTAATSD